MTFPFCEIIGKKLRSIGVGRRRGIFVSEIENAVEERRPEDEQEKRTPEFERVEEEENTEGRKDERRRKEERKRVKWTRQKARTLRASSLR